MNRPLLTWRQIASAMIDLAELPVHRNRILNVLDIVLPLSTLPLEAGLTAHIKNYFSAAEITLVL